MHTTERLRAQDAREARSRTKLAVAVGVLITLLAGLAFGWIGLIGGAAVVSAHLLLARARAKAPRAVLAVWHVVVFPVIVGTVLAAAPFEAWFIVLPLALGFWLAARVPVAIRLRRSTLPVRAAALATLALTLVVCDHLPVKALDRKIGPAVYRHVSLDELSKRMDRDHDLHFSVRDDGTTDRTVVDFEIPRPMSERAVLKKLARETGLDLEIGYCGTGWSILWGGGEPMVYLRPHERPQ